MQIPTMQGSAICCHEYFVAVSDVKNGGMTPNYLWHQNGMECCDIINMP